MQSFIFGGEGMAKTPQELERMREMARAMTRKSRTPQNVGEGIASLGDAILYRSLTSKADKAENAGISSANDAFSSLFSTPDPAPAVDPSAVVPPVDTSTQVDASTPAVVPPQTSTIKSPQDAVDAASANPKYDLRSGIRAAAKTLGVDPTDLATAISYETAGTFDPTKKGPTTQWGQHKGLIQFGEPQAEQFGVNWDDPLQSQLGPDGAVVKYLQSTGVKPGMGLLDIYSAINAGGVNRYDASDANNGGAPGTVADKVNNQMDGHRQKALALFADQAQQNDAFASQPGLTAQDQVPVVPVPDGFQQPDPLAMQEQPVEVADNSNYFPPAPRKKVADALQRIDPQKAIEILNNPYLPAGKKAVIQSLLKQQYDADNMAREQELKQADPKYQLDLEKGRLELGNLKNPPKARRMTEQEEKDQGFDTTGVYEIMPDGSTKTVQEPKKRNTATVNGQVIDIDTKEVIANVPEQVSPIEQSRLDLDKQKFEWEKTKKPETIQKYEYYKQSMTDLGQPPLGPLEWEQALRSSSAQRSEVNIDQKTEGAFRKKVAEKQAEVFSTMADEGMNARADLDIVNQLDTFLKGQGGATTGLAAAAARWGIPVEGADDLQAAEALINKLVPTQRQPGSGTMSDRDVELFKSSLPSLWNQPGGNEKILGIMRGMATYKQKQGEIADQVLMEELTPQEARRALRELPNPLEEFRKQEAAKKPVKVDGYTIEEVE